MSLIEQTQRYWTLNRSFWNLGLHKQTATPVHFQMREIAKETSSAKLKEIITRSYGAPLVQTHAGGG